MYKIFMIIALPVLAIGWLVYWLWDRKMAEIEKTRPKPVSKRLEKTRTEVTDWAKKMSEFQPPKRKTSSEPPQDDKQG
jgi:hypothetical protein